MKMVNLNKEQYKELAQKVGVTKMKAIEVASGISTGLLDSIEDPAKSPKNPKDSNLSVNLDCTKEDILKAMKEQGCTVADYNLVKFGEPDYVLFDNQETKAQTEQIVILHEQVTDSLIKSYDIAVKIGEILFNLKEKHIKRGKFGDWIKQNLPFSKRTGQRYMQIYMFREELAKRGIKSLTDAYREINGEPQDDEILEVDDSTDTKKKWEVVSATAEVDNLPLPKKKLKGIKETVQISPEVIDHMENRQCPFDGKFVKIVATIPSKTEYKALLSRYVAAADNLLVPGGKIIFVKRND